MPPHAVLNIARMVVSAPLRSRASEGDSHLLVPEVVQDLRESLPRDAVDLVVDEVPVQRFDGEGLAGPEQGLSGTCLKDTKQRNFATSRRLNKRLRPSPTCLVIKLRWWSSPLALS